MAIRFRVDYVKTYYLRVKLMKIILSRKGFDSSYGGYPSPILPEGRLLSFPIPDPNSPIKYCDLQVNSNTTVLNLINDLIGEEIEFIIGCKLPNSAYQYSAWWANYRVDEVHFNDYVLF